MRIQSSFNFKWARFPVKQTHFQSSNHKIKQEAYEMKGPLTKPTVKLIGEDGNSFSIMGGVKQSLRRADADKEYIDQYLKDATSGDYDHLLFVSMEYVEVK
jgi:hypothetical protein